MMREVKLEDPSKITFEEFKVLVGKEEYHTTEPERSSPYPKILDISALEYRNRRRSEGGFDKKVILLNRLTVGPHMSLTIGERELTELSII